MKSSAEKENIVIIGSGIGGLSAGILLARLGWRVSIVEKNSVPGGLMRSYRRAGLNCPVGVHYVGALGANEPLGRMFAFLGLNVENLFCRMGQEGVIDRYLFDDFSFDLPPGIKAYEENLRKAFPKDAAAIDYVMNNLREISGRMQDTAFLLNQGDPFQNMDYYQPLGEFLNKLAASPGLRAVLSVPCQLIGVEPDGCPLIIHHMVLAGYLFSAWRLKDSGAKMADILMERFYELGGKLFLNDAAEEILLESAKVTGIRLKSNFELPADNIIADVHPKILLNLLQPDSLRPSYRHRISGLQETDGVIAVQVSVDAAAHPEIEHNIYRLSITEKGSIEDGVFYQIRHGNNQSNLLSIITESLYREWSRWEETLSGKRGEDYEQKKLGIAHELLKNASVVFGELKNAEIIDVFTPLTIRDYVSCPEGSCYGVLRSDKQLLKIASINNLPIGGLYLTGQNALAPGVLGSVLGSFNVAKQILGAERFDRDIKRQI